jgi:methylisocitrate lyase
MLRAPSPSPGQALRDLWRERVVTMPGVYDAFSALCAARAGAAALYLSGAGVTNSALGAPDIGLITLTELAAVAARVCQAVRVPVLADADTGFGEEWNAVRTVLEMERAGLAGVHLEDQVSPKRCGHLEGKALIPAGRMAAKVRAAVAAKRDPAFVVCVRTDAAGVEGLDGAIARARRYVEAGADAIFPEGLGSEEEFAAFRAQVDGPLLANMTEFGKTPLIPAARFGELGYQMVIFPMTAFRVAHRALEEAYAELVATGAQAGLIDRMRTREELYAALDYARYGEEPRV